MSIFFDLISSSVGRLIVLALRWTGFAYLLISSFGAFAADSAVAFPVKPVRWIVPYPAGGSIDLVARVIAPRLYQIWGQQIVVDNRPGAGGRLGTQAAAIAPPDGYTQLLTLNTNFTIDRSMFRTMLYDPDKDFTPITIVASTPQVLVSNPSFPVKTVKDLIALAKAKPGQINYGSSGIGGSLHLAMEYFRSVTGIDMVHVPYKGGPPAAMDLMTGQIQVMFFNLPAAAPFIKAGKLKALGISTAKRSALLPDVPTIAEAGVPGFEIDVWYGLAAPAGTAPAIISKTYQDVAQILAMPDIRTQLTKLGADPVTITPEETARRIKAESAKWAKVIRGSKMSFD